MKTITEFSGFLLSDAIKKLYELTPRPPRPENKNDKGRHGAKFNAKGKLQAVEGDKNVKIEVAKEEVTAEVKAESSAEISTQIAVAPEVVAQETVPVSVAEVSVPTSESSLQNTQTQAQPTEVAAQTEAPAIDISKVMGETFKLEGEKLEMFMAAIDLVKKQWHHLKRVIVMQSAAEGEKAPQGAIEKNGKFYLVEHFFVPKPAFDPRKKGRGAKNSGRFGGKGKFGGKAGKGRFGDRRPNRGGKPGELNAEGATGLAAQNANSTTRDPGLGPDGKPWRNKKPRGPKKPWTTIGPNGELLGRDGTPFRPRDNTRNNTRDANKSRGPRPSHHNAGEKRSFDKNTAPTEVNKTSESAVTETKSE